MPLHHAMRLAHRALSLPPGYAVAFAFLQGGPAGATAGAALPAGRPLTIFAAGDVMLGRGVTPRLRSASTNLTLWHREISTADMAFCNLECALSPKKPARNTQLLASPQTIRYLHNAGFDAVSVANNHALDAGEAGVRLAQSALRGAKIIPLGTRIGGGAWHGWRTTVRGRSVALLAASAWGPFRSGRAAVRPLAGSGLLPEVRALAADGVIVLVSLHWGQEYAPTPSPGQRAAARALIDAGATAVIGHHPHVAQPVETYRGRPIFYSLGNFVFDRTPRPQSGLAALLSIDAARRVTWRPLAVQPCAGITGSQKKVAVSMAPAATVMARLSGHFLRGESRPQQLVWTRLADGLHRLRLLRREAAGWKVVAQGFHASIFSLQRGDIDGDGVDDILVGLNQRSKLDVAIRKRLHIYSADARRGFRPEWRGSGLSRPFRSFALLPVAVSRAADLVALESSAAPADKGFDWIAVYRWNGFGFRLLWNTPVRGTARNLRTGRDALGPFMRVEQSAPGLNRTLTLRAQTGVAGDVEFKASAAKP